MSTYINQIVRTTRRIVAIQAQLDRTTDRRTRTLLGRDYSTENRGREDLVLEAIRAGVEGDLIRWAIDMQQPAARAAVDELIERLIEELPAEGAAA